MSAVRGVFVQWEHFADKGGGSSSDVDVTLFGSKIIGLFEIYGVSARKKEDREGVGWGSADILRTRGEVVSSIFRDFMRMSFMDENMLTKTHFILSENQKTHFILSENRKQRLLFAFVQNYSIPIIYIKFNIGQRLNPQVP